MGAVLSVVALWLVYQLAKALYNISPFHPLSHIPGPKLAAATYWPEFYYDVIQYGCYTKQIVEMHKKYGGSISTAPYIHLLIVFQAPLFA